MRICAVLALVLALIGRASAEPLFDERFGFGQDEQTAFSVMPGCRFTLSGKLYNATEADMTLVGKAGKCFGAVLAVVRDLGGKAFCLPPKGVTDDQLVAAVVMYADEHPKDMHLEFRHLAAKAFQDVWPCKP